MGKSLFASQKRPRDAELIFSTLSFIYSVLNIIQTIEIIQIYNTIETIDVCRNDPPTLYAFILGLVAKIKRAVCHSIYNFYSLIQIYNTIETIETL